MSASTSTVTETETDDKRQWTKAAKLTASTLAILLAMATGALIAENDLIEKFWAFINADRFNLSILEGVILLVLMLSFSMIIITTRKAATNRKRRKERE